MRCARCHRHLKDPESILRGFGPYCWSVVQQEADLAAEVPFAGWDEYPASEPDPSAA